MRSRLITDPHDPSGEGAFNTVWDALDTNFFAPSLFPAASHGGGSPPAGAPPAMLPIPTPTPPEEAVQAQAAQSGSGGPGSVVAETSGGVTFNLIFDTAAMAAPASFRAGIEQAASILSSTITNKITVNINIDYSGTGGGAAAGPDNGLYESYSTVRSDLINNAAPGDTTFNALPTGSTIQGQSQVAVWNAQLKLWGLISPNDTTTDDGSATFATDINSTLLVGVALHELTHALGRVPYGPQPDIFDLFRFTSPGTQLMNGASTAPAAYFSVDGGYTKIADYGQTSDPSDFLNSGVQGGNDPFNEFYTWSTLQNLTAADKEQLDALGFNTIINTTGIVVAGTASEAIQGGARVALLSGPPNITDPSSATLSSATIKIAGSGGNAVAGDLLYINGVENGSVGNGVMASWNASTDTLTLTGSATAAVYDTLLSEVSYQDAGADSSTGSHPERTVTWTVNDGTANLSTTSQIAIDRAPVATVANVVLNANSTTVAASTLLTVSDPDGDSIASYAFKDAGNGHFFLNGVVQANNQEIDVTAAQLSHLTYESAGGTDSLQVRANDGTVWSAWQSFTVTGPAATVVEPFGSTSLVQVGNNYYLNSNSTGSGPEVKFGAAPLTAGEFVWTPIGAEQTSTGYEIALKDTVNGQYTVWITDSSGNVSYDPSGNLSGSSAALEAYETSFHQDLNGDGVIGIPAIESFGSTSLVQVGNNYYLNSNSTGSGPEVKFGAAPLTAGEFVWTPIGAEQTSTGYEIALKDTVNGQYTVWITDSSGNVSYDPSGNLSGSSAALEAYETSFHQDLNGDGVIGIPATTIESFGSTSLVQVGNNYYLNSNSTGSGPEVKFGAAPLTVGEFVWAPICAEQTSTGYEIALKDTVNGQYTVWITDSSGNVSYDPSGNLSGSSAALEVYETSFHQDLNGDGVIGIPVSAVATPATADANSAPVTFIGSTLTLDTPSTFVGQIVGFAGDGTLQNSDQIDLRGTNYNSIHSAYDNSTGILAVSDGTNTTNIHLLGNYLQDNFKFADDGSGGTIVYAQTGASLPSTPGGTAAGNSVFTADQNTFVFAPNFGQVTIANFAPETDTIQISKTVFANINALFGAMRDDSHGNAVITDAAHDTITIQNVTMAQLQAHQGDFHLV